METDIDKIDYKTGALLTFTQWQYVPDPGLEQLIQVKRVRASFLDAARSLIYLCQPDHKGKPLVDILTMQKFIELYPDQANEISDILATLKDAADWAVAACDPNAPNLPLLPEESTLIQQTWDSTLCYKSPGLRIASDRLVRRIRQDCPLNRRSRFALIRLSWVFAWTDGLILRLKGSNPLGYIERLNQ